MFFVGYNSNYWTAHSSPVPCHCSCPAQCLRPPTVLSGKVIEQKDVLTGRKKQRISFYNPRETVEKLFKNYLRKQNQKLLRS